MSICPGGIPVESFLKRLLFGLSSGRWRGLRSCSEGEDEMELGSPARSEPRVHQDGPGERFLVRVQGRSAPLCKLNVLDVNWLDRWVHGFSSALLCDWNDAEIITARSSTVWLYFCFVFNVLCSRYWAIIDSLAITDFYWFIHWSPCLCFYLLVMWSFALFKCAYFFLLMMYNCKTIWCRISTNVVRFY